MEIIPELGLNLSQLIIIHYALMLLLTVLVIVVIMVLGRIANRLNEIELQSREQKALERGESP